MLRSFLTSAVALSRASLREPGLADPLLELGDLVAAVLELAELLLDRLHLLVQVVLALGLLHLALDPRADPLLDLEDADLALHEAVQALQALGQRVGLEQLLLVRDLEREMGGHGVRELARIVDLAQRDQDLGRHLLVELHVLLELGDHGARQRLELARVGGDVGQHLGVRLEELRIVDEAVDLGARVALDQHLDRAVGQLEQLQHARDRADPIDVVGAGIVLAGILLRHQQDLLVVAHHLLERPDRFLATDEQRHDHVGEDHDVAQRQHGEQGGLGRFDHDHLTGLTSPDRTLARPRGCPWLPESCSGHGSAAASIQVRCTAPARTGLGRAAGRPGACLAPRSRAGLRTPSPRRRADRRRSSAAWRWRWRPPC